MQVKIESSKKPVPYSDSKSAVKEQMKCCFSMLQTNITVCFNILMFQYASLDLLRIKYNNDVQIRIYSRK